jgi:LysR family hca operon transcriptional activator
LFDVIERRRAAEEVSLTSGQAVENVLTLMTLIGLGLGFSLLPDYAQQLVFRGVTTRPLKGPEDRVDLAMAWRKTDDFAELNAFRELVMEARRAGRF